MPDNFTPVSEKTVYGKIEILGVRSGSRRRVFAWCRCECGKEWQSIRHKVVSGKTKTCGCSRRKKMSAEARMLMSKHGETSGGKLTPEYNSWVKLRNRCNNPKHHAYHLYGGRGIKVCQRWQESFTAFLEDMGRKPSPKHSIDRINGDGDYCPENCRWATAREQNNHLSSRRELTVNGVTLSVSDWARRLGVKPNMLYMRIKKGWDAERIVSTPNTNATHAPRGQGKRYHQSKAYKEAKKGGK
jgi:hypothetical protein